MEIQKGSIVRVTRADNSWYNQEGKVAKVDVTRDGQIQIDVRFEINNYAELKDNTNLFFKSELYEVPQLQIPKTQSNDDKAKFQASPYASAAIHPLGGSTFYEKVDLYE